MRLVVFALMALALTGPAYAADVQIKQGPEQTALQAPSNAKPSAPTTGKLSTAANVVKAFYSQLQNSMQNADTLGFDGRFNKMRPAIEQAFNLAQMTRFAVGPAWYKTTKADQAKLVAAFGDFSAATYASRFKKYAGEQFIVTGEKAMPGNSLLVETSLLPKDDKPVTLNYLMRKNDAGVWQIQDVFLNATISELATRRAEFSAIVQREGVPALLNSLISKKSALQSS